MLVLLRLHRYLWKYLHRPIWPFSNGIFPKCYNSHMGVPWGQGGSENSQNFPEAVGGGHPGVQLLCKVLGYSTRVKSQTQIHNFDCFKFINYPLESVGGDHGGVQLLAQIRGFRLDLNRNLFFKGFNNINSSHRLKTVKQLWELRCRRGPWGGRRTWGWGRSCRGRTWSDRWWGCRGRSDVEIWKHSYC